MAGPSLGTLLIQRLDAALGTTLSQQTQIVNRATSNPVPHPGETVRPEPIPGNLVRDARTNVDRASQGVSPERRVGPQRGADDTAAASRSAGQSVTTSATTSLGPAARIILSLFADAAISKAPLSARLPLLADALQTADKDAVSQTLSRALKQSLQQSGLFYESHLRSMLSGKYRLADVRQEPQAQIPTGALRSEAGTIPGLDPASHHIVRQQLEALADQSIHWRGEAWPGAPMDWQVRRQPEHQDEPTPQPVDEPAWQSQITLQLPRLGPVTLDVRLAGKQVYVRLQARDDTVAFLQRHAGGLHGQMTERELELTAITFAQSDTGEAT